MFQSSVFNYVNVLDKAADASWIRNEVIGNNIANADTPGYKRQDVAFESVLRQAIGDSSYRTMDAIYTDHANYSYRLDHNNVDPDTEGVKLAENQLKYQGLMTAIRQEFENLRTVMK